MKPPIAVLLIVAGALGAVGFVRSFQFSTPSEFGSFSSTPEVTFIEYGPLKGRGMRLLRDFTYTDPKGTAWTAEKGYETDGQEMKSQLAASMKLLRTPLALKVPDSAPALLIRFIDLELGFVPATGFDVHVTAKPDASLRRDSPSFVGSVALFRHQPPRAKRHSATPHGSHTSVGSHGGGDTFDISEAVASLDDAEIANLTVTVVPYSLLAIPGKETIHMPSPGASSRASGVQFLLAR